MLDYLRIALYALLILLSFLLFQAWNQDHPLAPPVAQTDVASNRQVPKLPDALPASNSEAVATLPESSVGEKITVTTDLLNVTLDTRGGDVIEEKLLQYPQELNAPTPILLLNDNEKTRYVAESGLLSKQGPDTPEASALYKSTQSAYTLNADSNTIEVPLTWQSADGLNVTKLFTFTRGSYEIKVTYLIENLSKQPWEGSFYAQLKRTDVPPPSHGGLINLATYFGAAMATPQKPFTKISFKDMHEKSVSQTVTGGWAAMIQHYFISAWVPAKDATSTYYTRALPNGLYAIGMMEQPITVQPGAKTSTEAKLYTGPAIADLLEKTAPGLKLTIDYGWFWFISAIIFWMMQKIYDVVGNWGWSIVLVTVIIK